jgi:hypothetical protein
MKDGRSALLQVPVTGGEPVEIPLPFGSFKVVFGYATRQSAIFMGGSETEGTTSVSSPDGFPLWMIPVTSGAPRRVGNLRAFDAALSRDGEWIALRQRSRILLARQDGTIVRVLAELPRDQGGLRWSPASRAMRYTGLRWSPDGRTLRYTARGPGGKGSGSSLLGDPWVWETTVESGATKGLWPGVVGDWSSDDCHYFFPRWDVAVRRSSLWVVRERSGCWPRPRPVHLTLGPLDRRRRRAGWTSSLGTTLRELQRVVRGGRLTPRGLSAPASHLAMAVSSWVAYRRDALAVSRRWYRATAANATTRGLSPRVLSGRAPDRVRRSQPGRERLLRPADPGERRRARDSGSRVASGRELVGSVLVAGRAVDRCIELPRESLGPLPDRCPNTEDRFAARRACSPVRAGTILAAELPTPGSADPAAARIF